MQWGSSSAPARQNQKKSGWKSSLLLVSAMALVLSALPWAPAQVQAHGGGNIPVWTVHSSIGGLTPVNPKLVVNNCGGNACDVYMDVSLTGSGDAPSYFIWEIRSIGADGQPNGNYNGGGPNAWYGVSMTQCWDSCRQGETVFHQTRTGRPFTGAPGPYYEVRLRRLSDGHVHASGMTTDIFEQEPLIPKALEMRDVKPFNIELHWPDKTTDETAFQVQRSIDGGASWTQIAELPSGTTSLADFPPALPLEPFYRVRAVRSVGGQTLNTPWSNVVGAILDIPTFQSSGWWEPSTTMTNLVSFGDPELRRDYLAGTVEWDLNWTKPQAAWDEGLQAQIRSIDEGVPVSSWENVGSSFNCGSQACTQPRSVSWTPTLTQPGPTYEVRLVGATNPSIIYLRAGTLDVDPTYVALGDSYSSGVGVNPTNTDCQRSTLAYQYFVQPFNMGKRFIACGGAETSNVLPGGTSLHGEPPQLDQGVVTTETDLVTITIGGNDAGFGAIINDCFWAIDCSDSSHTIFGQPFESWVLSEIDALGGSEGPLAQTFEAIKDESPGSRVLVLGYPQLFADSATEQSCFKLMGDFQPGEQDILREFGSHLNTVMAAAAIAANVEFVDVTDHFENHEICGEDGEWINYLVASAPTQDSFHPNEDGQSEYAAPIALHLQDPEPNPLRANISNPVGRVANPPGSLGSLTVSEVATRCDNRGLSKSVRVNVSGFGYKPGSRATAKLAFEQGSRAHKAARFQISKAGAFSQMIEVSLRKQPAEPVLVKVTGDDVDAGKRIAMGFVSPEDNLDMCLLESEAHSLTPIS